VLRPNLQLGIIIFHISVQCDEHVKAKLIRDRQTN
jgi:hypothetical protein